MCEGEKRILTIPSDKAYGEVTRASSLPLFSYKP